MRGAAQRMKTGRGIRGILHRAGPRRRERALPASAAPPVQSASPERPAASGQGTSRATASGRPAARNDSSALRCASICRRPGPTATRTSSRSQKASITPPRAESRAGFNLLPKRRRASSRTASRIDGPATSPASEHQRALGQPLGDRTRPDPGAANALARVPQHHLDLRVPAPAQGPRRPSADTRVRALARERSTSRDNADPLAQPDSPQRHDRHRRIAPQPRQPGRSPRRASPPQPPRRSPPAPPPAARSATRKRARLRGQQAEPGLGGVTNRKRRRSVQARSRRLP